jgi:hypothetical protein
VKSKVNQSNMIVSILETSRAGASLSTPQFLRLSPLFVFTVALDAPVVETCSISFVTESPSFFFVMASACNAPPPVWVGKSLSIIT